jgi:hypothetical protein
MEFEFDFELVGSLGAALGRLLQVNFCEMRSEIWLENRISRWSFRGRSLRRANSSRWRVKTE